MKKGLGLILILAAVAVGFGYLYFGPEDSPHGSPGSFLGTRPVETVQIRYGSEKKGLLDDPELQNFLRKEFYLQVDGAKMGSLEMSAGNLNGLDALWPSSDLAALLFAVRHPNVSFKKHNIFSTPMVFYSWPTVVEALEGAGVVQRRENAYRVLDLKALLDLMAEKRTWKSLGLPYQAGQVSFRCTDPAKSNSGFLIAGLLAIVMNEGAMIDEEALSRHMPRVAEIFKSMGYMEESSGILFDKYVKQGQGVFPLVANYESLMVEFYQANPGSREQIRNNILVLVPEPTVWSEHPLIALTAKGARLMEALQHPKVQKLAWERFGFRSGAAAIGAEAAVYKELGLAGRIQSATVLPSMEIMERILGALHS
jgi:hypothetical protein